MGGSGISGQHRPITIAHVIHRLDYGGLENGLINLVNRLDADRYRHHIVCMTSAHDFSNRITAGNVDVVEIGKRADAKDLAAYARVMAAIRRIRPDIVHTRNLPAVDVGPIAKLVGAPRLIQGEHGLDMVEIEPGPAAERYRRLRRFCRLFTDRYIALGKDLKRFLIDRVGVDPTRIEIIYNGVDTDRFHAAAADEKPGVRAQLLGGAVSDDTVIIGTVGRLEDVKNQIALVHALAHLAENDPALAARIRLVMVGGGSRRDAIEAEAASHGLAGQVRITGYRDDVPALMRGLDIFALPSVREGLSNTLLEAMATGLPAVATAVGGNPELIDDGSTGLLVPLGDSRAMARAISRLASDDTLRARMGAGARARALNRFSLAAMVENYNRVYMLTAKHTAAAASAA